MVEGIELAGFQGRKRVVHVTAQRTWRGWTMERERREK